MIAYVSTGDGTGISYVSIGHRVGGIGPSRRTAHPMRSSGSSISYVSTGRRVAAALEGTLSQYQHRAEPVLGMA
eukprot:3189239-Rhodomonas_salina.8